MANTNAKPNSNPKDLDAVMNHVSATTRDAVLGTQEEAAAAKTAAELEKEASKGIKSVKNAGGDLADGAKAIAEKIREWGVGSKDGAKGAIGGVAGFIKGAGDKTLRVVGGAGSIVGKTASKFPGTTLVVAAVAAIVAARSFFKNRDKEKELETVQKANELTEMQMANAKTAAAMPQFDNSDAKGGFADKYGTRSQSAAAR